MGEDKWRALNADLFEMQLKKKNTDEIAIHSNAVQNRIGVL